MEKRSCTCALWQIGDAQIASMYSVAYTHGKRYKATMFRYCPWCGSELERVLVSERSQKAAAYYAAKEDAKT